MKASPILMTSRAAAIRERMKDAPMAIDPPRDDTYDADENAKLFKELDALQKRLSVESYIVMWGEVPVATIVLRQTEAQCTAIVTKFVNNQRVMWKATERGIGYDRRTAVLSGLSIPCTYSHYEADHSARHFVLRNEGERWDTQFRNNGFKVWRTL